MKRIIGICTIVFTCVFATHAAFACNAGYYLSNNQCVACQGNHYCPGDGQIYECPAFTYDNIEDLYPMVTGYNVHSIGSARLRNQYLYTGYQMTDIEHCVLVLFDIEVDEGKIGYYIYRYSPISNAYDTFDATWWTNANAGYYMSPAISWAASEIWSGAKPCTNSHPANSHYSGPGTPDSKDGSVVDANDCPWECDAGYWNNNGTCTACPTGYTSNAGATAENQCFITVTGGHYIGTAGQNSTNWETCAAGYARAEHTVNYGSTSSCDKCTGATYTDTAGASSCTACPIVTGELASRAKGIYDLNGSDHRSVNQCYAYFSDDDPNGTYTLICYYNSQDGEYGGAHSICQTWPALVRSCVAGTGIKLSESEYWQSNWGGASATGLGLDFIKGQVCGPCPENTYSPEGATTCTACPSGLYAPAGMSNANQCGHILHVGDAAVYLHSTKKTSPAVHVKIGNDIFYGNMTTADVVMHAGTTHKLKVNFGGQTYSIYDDTVNPNE